MTEIDPPNWYINLGSRPVTIKAGRGVFVPGATRRFLVGSSSLTERHFSIHWVLLVPQYRGEITVDEFCFRVRPGVFVIAPPHATITLRFEGRAVQYWAHVSLSCGREPGILIPCVTRLRRQRKAIESMFSKGIAAFERNDAAAANEIFGCVLEFVANLEAEKNVTHRNLPPRMRDALHLIEEQLHRPIYVEEIAHKVGLGRRQLLNQFQEQFSTTVSGYIRQRRIERALILLRRTSIPIKAVAVESGIDDLQMFNKLVRRAVGLGPRAYREQSHAQAPVPEPHPGRGRGTGAGHRARVRDRSIGVGTDDAHPLVPFSDSVARNTG